MQQQDMNAVFNKRLADFVEDLGGVLGHLPQYSVLRNTVKFLTRLQPDQNQRLFERFVVNQYGQEIEARDEAFLLSETYSGACAQAEDGDSIVALIKSVWRNLSGEDKESIWAHMHVLLAISRNCTADRAGRS